MASTRFRDEGGTQVGQAPHDASGRRGVSKTEARSSRRRDRPGLPRDAGGPERSAEQVRYDGPPLDASITGQELDRSLRRQLQALPEKLAIRVAKHLVAAGQLIATEPRTAYLHTVAARARAPRISVVREACGEAAYAAGEYAEALAELRAAKRMSGVAAYLPLMADCERALGRPERALALAKDPGLPTLDAAQQAEMRIVEAGARRDLGQPEAALRVLESGPLRSRSRATWVVRLRYAYADALLAAGRREEAVEWFSRAVGADAEATTDAAARLAELEGVVLTDTAPSGDAAPAGE